MCFHVPFELDHLKINCEGDDFILSDNFTIGLIDDDYDDLQNYDLCSIDNTTEWYKKAVSDGSGKFNCHESIKIPEDFVQRFKDKKKFMMTDFIELLDPNSDCVKNQAYKNTTLFAQVSCGFKPEDQKRLQHLGLI